MLTLYNLPKDLLIKIISVIRRRTENQYNKYIVITFDEVLRTDTYDDESGVKSHILSAIYRELISNSHHAVFDIDHIPQSFSVSMWKTFIEKCSSQYSLQQLMKEAEKLTVTPLQIIKGKIILESARPYFYEN
jgi:hypothetical protein